MEISSYNDFRSAKMALASVVFTVSSAALTAIEADADTGPHMQQQAAVKAATAAAVQRIMMPLALNG
ncbi:hypothetical protein J14TS5_00190 [Paenibacillus lautus]|nr:hypothetical protein J14TS5_00190 [Paenibacillus lautus]